LAYPRSSWSRSRRDTVRESEARAVDVRGLGAWRLRSGPWAHPQIEFVFADGRAGVRRARVSARGRPVGLGVPFPNGGIAAVLPRLPSLRKARFAFRGPPRYCLRVAPSRKQKPVERRPGRPPSFQSRSVGSLDPGPEDRCIGDEGASPRTSRLKPLRARRLQAPWSREIALGRRSTRPARPDSGPLVSRQCGRLVFRSALGFGRGAP
jgi:hypothetical protein